MQTKTVDVHEADTHVVELLAWVSAGTEITLTAGNTPLASITWSALPNLEVLFFPTRLLRSEFLTLPLTAALWPASRDNVSYGL